MRGLVERECARLVRVDPTALAYVWLRVALLVLLHKINRRSLRVFVAQSCVAWWIALHVAPFADPFALGVLGSIGAGVAFVLVVEVVM